MALFTWIPKIVDGLSLKHINMDQDSKPQLQSRLTRIIEDKTKQDVTKGDGEDETKLSEIEVQYVLEFFNNDIKNKPAKDVMKVFNKMFKDFKNPKLKKYFMHNVSSMAGMNFDSVAQLVLNVCKQTPRDKKLEMLFNIFCKGKSLL